MIIHRLPNLFVLEDTGTLAAGPDLRALGLSSETRCIKSAKEEKRSEIAKEILCMHPLFSVAASLGLLCESIPIPQMNITKNYILRTRGYIIWGMLFRKYAGTGLKWYLKISL